MIQWGRDHGAKEEDLVAHMNSKTLAMADTCTRDKTIVSPRLLHKINDGMRKEAVVQSVAALAKAPRSIALSTSSKAAPTVPRAKHWSKSAHLNSNLRNSVQLPSTNACPRCLLKMSLDRLPAHMLLCRKVWDAQPDVLPESEYQWYEMLEQGARNCTWQIQWTAPARHASASHIWMTSHLAWWMNIDWTKFAQIA